MSYSGRPSPSDNRTTWLGVGFVAILFAASINPYLAIVLLSSTALLSIIWFLTKEN